MSGLLVAIAIFVVVAVLLVKGVRTVSQGEEWVVERFGKYLRTLPPGLSFINPLFDRVAYRVITKDIVLDIDKQEVITSDNAVIATNAVSFIKVSDPVACVYGVVDFRDQQRIRRGATKHNPMPPFNNYHPPIMFMPQNAF